MNYPQDVEFTDVSFVSADVGWAVGHARTTAGEGGFILKTEDGGQNWKLQLGDPQSATRSFTSLRFVDATHGWAFQWSGQLVRTTDGENWEVAGAFSSHSDYVFTTPTTGVSFAGSEISKTTDAGGSWKPVYSCGVKIEVEGLLRDTSCHVEGIHFPSPAVGYAVTRALPNSTSAVLKTADGGTTWNVWSFLPAASGAAIFFTTEDAGFIRASGRLFATSDAGKTWRGVPATLPGGSPAFHFADGGAGWICLGNDSVSTLAYTNDGGKRWNTREYRFPARVNACSLPRSDRGYVVGIHGMVYRYRVVPIEYTSKGMMAAHFTPPSPEK